MSELYKALFKFQQVVTPVKKTKVVKNRDGSEKYRYADLEDVISHIKPFLSESGVGFYQNAWTEEGYVYVTTTVFHGESGQSFTSKPFGANIKDNIGYMTNVQACGTIESYCRRYSLAPTLGLSTELDNDGNNYGDDTPDEAKIKIEIEDKYNAVKRGLKSIKHPASNKAIADYIKNNRSVASMTKAMESLNYQCLIEASEVEVVGLLGNVIDTEVLETSHNRIKEINDKRVAYIDSDVCLKAFDSLKSKVLDHISSLSDLGEGK